MIEFSVDTNGMDSNGKVLASRRRVTSDVAVGDTVRVTDISDMKRYSATVLSVTSTAVELLIEFSSEMLPLDQIDTLAHRYFADVPDPKLVQTTSSQGSAKRTLTPRDLTTDLVEK